MYYCEICETEMTTIEFEISNICECCEDKD